MLTVQLLVTGIQTGALYALTAAGFALIFGATRVFHVAHGAVFLLAGYIFLTAHDVGLGWIVSILLATLAAVGAGLLAERLVYRPIQRSEGSFFTVFVASFGITILIQSMIELLFGRGFVVVSTPLTRSTEVLPGLFLAPIFWVTVAATIAVSVIVGLFLSRAPAGLALRALFHNPELIRAYGLSSNRISALAFAIGSALTVPAAVLTALSTGLQPAAGHHLMLISLTAAFVGGIGSLRGAALAGLLLGLAENLAVLVVDTQWAEAVSFLVLFAFILFRPHGIFGEAGAK